MRSHLTVPLMVALVGAGLTACAETPSGIEHPAHLASVLDITTSVNTTSIRPGERLEITVAARNTTDRRVRFARSGCFLLYEIRDASGGLVSSAFGCRQISITEVFEPGEIKRQHFLWTGVRHDPADRSLPFRSLPVTAGEYELVGYLAVHQGPRSEPTRVRVLPTFTLTLSAEPPQASVGDVVTVTATLRNESPLSFTLDVLSTCTFAIQARRDWLTHSDLSECKPADRRIPLEPGQRLTETVDWRVGEPGEYALTARVGRPSLRPDLTARAQVSVR